MVMTQCLRLEKFMAAVLEQRSSKMRVNILEEELMADAEAYNELQLEATRMEILLSIINYF